MSLYPLVNITSHQLQAFNTSNKIVPSFGLTQRLLTQESVALQIDLQGTGALITLAFDRSPARIFLEMSYSLCYRRPNEARGGDAAEGAPVACADIIPT